MSSSSLAAARSVSTPVKQTPPAVRDSPGNWKHPRLAEITRRQSKTTFNENNIKHIVYNVGALVVIAVLRRMLLPVWPRLVQSPSLKEYGSLIFTVLLLIPLVNIGLALLPLVRPTDDLSDIPLTPSQRKLLGLPPTSGRPAATTPGSVYSTPPKYARTPSIGGTPASLRSQMSGGGNGSPLSGSTSEQLRRTSNQSPLSASPLLHKMAVGGGGVGGMGGGRRSSFGTSTASSTLGASTASSLFGDMPSTPTPGGKRSSVSLNNKWLYEKGRRASGNSFFNQSIGS